MKGMFIVIPLAPLLLSRRSWWQLLDKAMTRLLLDTQRRTMLPEGLLLYLLLAVIPTTHATIDHKRAPSFLENVLSSSADQRSCKVSKVAMTSEERSIDATIQPTGLIQDACCDFETIESVNRELHAQLEDLVLQEYFRYWRVDLFRECPFWQDSDAFCGNQACAVQELSEENIPEHWRTQALSELSKVNASAVDQVSICVHYVSLRLMILCRENQTTRVTFVNPISVK